MNDTQNIALLSLVKLKLHEKFGENIKDVILFGSRAKGTATEFSDYDILIILNGSYDWKTKDQFTEIMYDIELENDVMFDKHLLSANEINSSLRGCEPIYLNAIKNGIYA